ncbi:MAG: arsenate reductase [Flavobacteriaceae bacterium]|nr:arsenate reductase [Flavobacteriaceae bacterium]|tara:strand:- start:4582 stop:4932 length:351 start_codon:yes stop_codon:yes gene_type:complete
MLKVYHNPRCRKSREAINFLKKSNVEFQIVLYLEKPLSPEQLKEIIKKLKILPEKLIRRQEKIWKENFKNKNLSNKKVIEILSSNPKLIERPIITSNNKGIIGRPIENLAKFLNNV